MLAQCLGIVPMQLQMTEVKWLYWSENPLGTMLCGTLERLSDLGVLDKREEPDLQYRWCATIPRHGSDLTPCDVSNG